MSSKVTWKDIFEDFKKHNPVLCAHGMHYEPYEFLTIKVWLNDGEIALYDYFNKKITRTNTYWKCSYQESSSMEEQNDEHMLRVRFSKNVRQILKDKGITQKLLCAKTGISQRTLTRTMDCERTINLYDAFLIAEALGCTLDYLI